MLAIALIVIFLIYLIFFFPYLDTRPEETTPKIRDSVQMKKLWGIAQVAMKNHHTLRAEKALLTILRFDETNASAYNRLGILYAKEKKWDDAIECFEIAQSLENNASSLHNVGLIYLETEQYDKASQAFEQAIALEGDLPARYIAYAKSEEKQGNRKNALEALETAFSLDPSTATLRHILEVYERAEDTEGIEQTKARIAEILESRRSATPAKTPPKSTPKLPPVRRITRKKTI